MPDTGLSIGLSIGSFLCIGLVGVGWWIASTPREEIDRWQPPWKQWLSNRRRHAGHGWEGLTGLDGAVELAHVNGAANGTPTAPATNTAHGTTHNTADDTVTNEASGTAAATSDASTDTSTDITLVATSATDMTDDSASGLH